MPHHFKDDNGDEVTISSASQIAFIRLSCFNGRTSSFCIEVNFAGPFGSTDFTLRYDTRERAAETFRALEALLPN